MALDAITAMMSTNASNAAASSKADSVTGNLKNISSETSADELMDVCKDFASYFVEEILKEMKENMTLEEEDEDPTVSMMTDYHMDSTIELLADELTDTVGGGFIQQMYEQMKRNYNITE